MAKKEHLAKLKEGVSAWNKWREDDPEIEPDLIKADLRDQAFHLSGANLSEAMLNKADFRGQDLIRVDFSDAHLHRADIRGADLQDAILEDTNVRGIIYKDKYKGKKAKFMGIRVASCYGDPGFKRYAQDQEYIEMIQQSRPNLYRWWSITSDCGRSIWRWISWSFGLALYFAAIFWLLGTEHFHVKSPLPPDAITMVYYSVVTFTTLGFGDITPKTQIGACVVMIEVVIGYVMLGGLISIMATKLARRA